MVGWGAMLQGAGSIIGGLTSAFGASQQMSQEDAMHKQAALNWEQHKKSLTEGPRLEKAGLRRAGINPLLRYGEHGAPLPSTAQGVSQAPPVNPLSGLAEGIGGAMSSAADVYSKVSQANKAVEELNQIAANVQKIKADTKLSEAQRGTEFEKQQLMFADRMLRYTQDNKMRAETDLIRRQWDLVSSQVGINKWIEASAEVNARIAQAGLPRALADEELFDSWFGKIMRYADTFTKSVNPWGAPIPRPGTTNTNRIIQSWE